MKENQSEPIAARGISIVVPAFNEEEGLQEFLTHLQSFRDKCPHPLEVVIVDDGSSDATEELLRDVPYTVIRHETNLGYGAAIKTGIENTRHEAVLIIDADGTYNTEDILAVVAPLDRYDMVIGARTGEDTQDPIARRPAKWLIRVFAAWLVHRPIPDLNSGLRSFRRREIDRILKLLPDGFSLTTTLTVAFHSMGRRVYYQTVQYRKRSGRSKFRPLADTWNMILLILRTVVLFRPLNVFLPLSLLLALTALGVAVISKVMGQFMDATFIVLMMTSIQMFVLGLIADLIVRINLWTH